MIKLIKLFSKLNFFAGLLFLIVPIIYLLVIAPLQPTVVASNMTPEQETSILMNKLSDSSGILNESNISTTKVTINSNEKQYIKIPSIGVDATLYEGSNSSTLEKGIWIMPWYGTPDNTSQPTVIAGHRWGADREPYPGYRDTHLFHKLNELNPGDIVYIVWNGSEYKYKVTVREESEYVSKMSDLILITCKYYNSPIRIIVYAQRIQS